MALPQKKMREIVLQALYCYDCFPLEKELFVPFLMEELSVTKRNMGIALEKVERILERLEEIDGLLAAVSLSYEFDRIQRVEKNVLRLGLYEMLFDDEIPQKVAISEAIRIAKKFSTPEAATFVNALLDTLYKNEKGEAPDRELLESSIEALKESEENSQKAIEDEEEKRTTL